MVGSRADRTEKREANNTGCRSVERLIGRIKQNIARGVNRSALLCLIINLKMNMIKINRVGIYDTYLKSLLLFLLFLIKVKLKRKLL